MSPSSLGLVALVHVQQRLQRVGGIVDRGVAIAHLGEARGHRRDREVLGRDLGELVPRDRRGDRRARLRPHAVGRGDGAIARVLVVVDEDALAALLLPPLRRHLARQPPLELAPEGDRGVADVRERPARLDPDVDVDASASRGLREAGVAELVQEHARLGGDAHGVGEVGARLRVEVEAQLVGMVDVVAANRPRMKRDRAHLGRPADDGHLRGADLVRVATRRELDPRGLHVVRRSRGMRFWKKASPPPFSRVERTMPGCTPFGQRSSVVGRRSSARMMPSSTAR